MKHPKFAQMNDVNISVVESSEEPPEEKPTERVETSRLLAYSPLLKMIVIGGGIFMFVGTIGAIINGSLNALNTTSKIEPSKQVAQEAETQIVDETQKDKTLLALTTQSTALKSLRDRKVTVQPTPTTSPTSISVVATPVRTPVRTQPTFVQKNPPPPTAPMSRTISRPPAPIQPAQQLPTKPRPVPITQNKLGSSPTRTTPTQTLDPMQQWQAVADAGSFSAPDGESGLEKELAMGIEGGTGQAPSSMDENNEVQTNGNSKRILVGTTSSGKLETPIVWANNDYSSQNYLVRLTKELTASDGSVVVPVGSYLVVSLANTNTEGYAQLYGTAIVVNHNGDTQEKTLPSGAVRILASDGKLLKAKSGRGSDLMGSVFSAALAGVTKASEIQNRATSSITTSSNGFTSSSVTNENRDTVAGFSEGAFGSILQEMKAANERRAQSLNNQNKVYAIEAGKTVRIYFNQSISI